jgi:hypothetical protein
LPVLLGTGAAATADWSFLYVTMKFILVPGMSLAVLGALSVSVFRRTRIGWRQGVAGTAAFIYLASLALWPVPWFA